jgi:uncharacterized protein YjiS (DUF1127 family)
MPAHSKRFDWISALRRLLGRRRSAPQRRAGLHDLTYLSDRMLADIGVRRADVHAALSGLMPAQHIARTRGGAPWTAQLHRLRPPCREAAKTLPPRNLGAAA